MTESTKAIASLKKASNYTKLAMRAEGPRSFKRGQGALLKVIRKFGKDGVIDKDEAKKVLGWRGCDVRSVAKIAEENGYVSIDDNDVKFTMSLTEKGSEIVQKRLEAESVAADKVLSGLTDEEKAQLVSLCDKISTACEDMGIDYGKIQKRHGRKCGTKHNECHCHHKGHGEKEHCRMEKHGCKNGHGPHHHNHDAPRFVFVFEDGGKGGHHEHHCCKHHH